MHVPHSHLIFLATPTRMQTQGISIFDSHRGSWSKRMTPTGIESKAGEEKRQSCGGGSLRTSLSCDSCFYAFKTSLLARMDFSLLEEEDLRNR
ncbi:uncharacterized protein [Manis javanica]|uniref:uncharacterized protein n=1 Tax=Manis javanica TaxID=9974 RepID=UPI003C6DAE84